MYIVMYDDSDSICVPMTWDDDCEGALCSAGGTNNVAVFADREEARTAIQISTQFAKLCKAQKKPHNADFIEYRRFVHVVPLVDKCTRWGAAK